MNIINIELIIIGGGPGGYHAAIKASKLNIKTILIDNISNLGGTCLNSGCIPTKAMLYLSKLLKTIENFSKIGILQNTKQINIKNLHKWKDKIINDIKKDIVNNIKNNNIKIINDQAKFISNYKIITKKTNQIIKFKNAIIATGSIEKLLNITSKKYDFDYINSALNFKIIPKQLLIVGGGSIGLELATIYSSFKTNIDIIDESKDILNDQEKQIKDIYKIELKKIINNLYLNVKIKNIKKRKKDFVVIFGKNEKKIYDKIIISIGRLPNVKNLGLENTNIKINKQKFIYTNYKQQTTQHNIYACGDITGKPMLAHKAIYQGILAAEAISGLKYLYKKKCIPSIIYTNPEIAKVGITEKEIKILNKKYKVKMLSWANNEKARIINSENGFIKMIFNENNKIVGASLIGNNCEELISELALAIEMECNELDILSTIHPHPTISEIIQKTANI